MGVPVAPGWPVWKWLNVVAARVAGPSVYDMFRLSDSSWSYARAMISDSCIIPAACCVRRPRVPMNTVGRVRVESGLAVSGLATLGHVGEFGVRANCRCGFFVSPREV